MKNKKNYEKDKESMKALGLLLVILLYSNLLTIIIAQSNPEKPPAPTEPSCHYEINNKNCLALQSLDPNYSIDIPNTDVAVNIGNNEEEPEVVAMTIAIIISDLLDVKEAIAGSQDINQVAKNLEEARIISAETSDLIIDATADKYVMSPKEAVAIIQDIINASINIDLTSRDFQGSVNELSGFIGSDGVLSTGELLLYFASLTRAGI